MRDLTCTGFRAALYLTGAWMFITLWSGSATAGSDGVMAGATMAGLLTVPVILAWALTWLLSHRAEARRRPALCPNARLTGTGRGVPRALALMVGLMGVLLIAGEAGMVHMASYRDLVPLDRDVPIAAQTLESLGQARHLSAVIEIALFTAFTLTFLVAAGLLRQELENRGAAGFRWTWRWTAVTLFIPVLNLVRPWLGLAEIERAVSGSVETERVGDTWRKGARLSLPTALIAVAWFVRFGTETTVAQATPLSQAITDSAAWHAAVTTLIDRASVGLGVDLLVMGIMVWWVWRLHGRIRRI